MSIDIKEILSAEEEFIGESNPQAKAGIESLSNSVDFARGKGWVRARLPKDTQIPKRRSDLVMPELEDVIALQVERNVALGFPEELGKSADEYRADFILPEGADQPEEYAGRFDVALAFEPRIPLKRKHELARKIKELGLDRAARGFVTSQVKEYADSEMIEDLPDYSLDKPCILFTHDGQRYRRHSVKDAKQLFDEDEIDIVQQMSTDLYLHKLAYFRGRGVWASGSRFEGRVPYLRSWYGEPYLGARWGDRGGPGLGVLSRGKKILELGL